MATNPSALANEGSGKGVTSLKNAGRNGLGEFTANNDSQKLIRNAPKKLIARREAPIQNALNEESQARLPTTI
jgi:hypothetical protein